MKVISYSLWGANPVYTHGAIRNAELAARFYPEWICVFHCFPSVPDEITAKLEAQPNAVVRKREGNHDEGDCRGMFERFLPADEPGVDCVISRDTDSRPSTRERLAVEAWLAQGTDLHVMRDHPYHGAPILGGMWGVKGGRLKGISEAIRAFSPSAAKGQDQVFLRNWVWEKVRAGELSATIHDPVFLKSPFPDGACRGPANDGVWFVGQCFDEHDRFNSQSDIDSVRGRD